MILRNKPYNIITILQIILILPSVFAYLDWDEACREKHGVCHTSSRCRIDCEHEGTCLSFYKYKSIPDLCGKYNDPNIICCIEETNTIMVVIWFTIIILLFIGFGLCYRYVSGFAECVGCLCGAVAAVNSGNSTSSQTQPTYRTETITRTTTTDYFGNTYTHCYDNYGREIHKLAGP